MSAKAVLADNVALNDPWEVTADRSVWNRLDHLLRPQADVEARVDVETSTTTARSRHPQRE